jgi:hypothetical protein
VWRPRVNAKCGHCGRQPGISSKLNITLPYETAIPLLGINPRKLRTYSLESL